MEGARRREQRQVELLTFVAWQTERFAREKRLKPFPDYAEELRPRRKMRAREMLQSFQEMQARGAKMTIRQVG